MSETTTGDIKAHLSLVDESGEKVSLQVKDLILHFRIYTKIDVQSRRMVEHTEFFYPEPLTFSVVASATVSYLRVKLGPLELNVRLPKAREYKKAGPYVIERLHIVAREPLKERIGWT